MLPPQTNAQICRTSSRASSREESSEAQKRMQAAAVKRMKPSRLFTLTEPPESTVLKGHEKRDAQAPAANAAAARPALRPHAQRQRRFRQAAASTRTERSHARCRGATGSVRTS